MQSVDKKYFLFNKGINTEAPLVAWPEGFTIDEQNFDLLPDGSRRRRLGISYEAGGGTAYYSMLNSSEDMSSGTKFYRWRNVNNTDEFNFLVLQVGASLYFWNDVNSGPLGEYLYEFPLEDYKVSYVDPATDAPYEATLDQLKAMVCSFTEADGRLIIVGEHIKPFFISFEDDALVGEEIEVVERDMFGIDDGISVEATPAELTPEHEYNLYARGWTYDNIDAVFVDKGVYPAKNMIQFLGLRKQTESGYSDDDGVKVFSPDKLMAELFQNMSAPLGHVSRDVFNRRTGYGSIGQSNTFKAIASVDSVDTGLGRVTITTAEGAHGVQVNDELEILNLVLKLSSVRVTKKVNFTGAATVKEVIDADTIVIEIDSPMWEKYPIYMKTVEKGQYSIGGLIQVEFEGTEPAETRFTVTTSYAGRIFYGGCPDNRLTDRIYFSKVIENDSDFGKCLQEADPTSEYISDLLPSDGGYITIPNLGTLRGLMPYGRALLVLSSEGVWAIGPGEGGIFSAVGYSVNKLSDAGCVSKQSIIIADNTPLYWSNAGIYAIMQDDNSGFLSSLNITQDTINGLFHSIRYDEKTRVKAGYDPVRKRVFFLYNSRLTNPQSGNPPVSSDEGEYSTSLTPLGLIDDEDTVEISYDTALIFDIRLKAWIKWVFGSDYIKVRDILCLPTNYSTDSLNGGLRFLCQETASTKYYLGELTSTLFEDWGTESPAFLYTGPDSLGEPERLRYAPYVHVFMRKESKEPLVVSQTPGALSYATPGSDVALTLSGRSSSLFMQPRWDWARGSDSGKIQNYVQVYRETKPNPDSFGLVVTKNKVRGRGRNLFLAFKAGEKSPAWLDGWTVKYDAQIRI
jgi:hypothetical protein